MTSQDENIKYIKEDIKNSLKLLNKAKTKEEVYILCLQLESLISFYQQECKFEILYSYIFYKNKLNRKIYLPKSDLESLNNQRNFIKNKKFFAELSEDIMDEIENDIEKEYYNIDNIKINEETKKKMVLKFISNKYQEDYKIAKNIFNTSLFCNFTKYLYTIGCSGAYLYNYYKNSGYIFSNGKNNFLSLATLAHEIGHAVEYQKTFYGASKRKFVDFNLKSNLCEVYSSLYEYDFYKYYLENNKLNNMAKNYITSFYIDLYNELNDLMHISILPSKLIEKDKYKNLTKERLYMELLKTGNAIMDIEEMREPFTYDVHSNLIYGMGKTFSLYLSNLRENDIEKYKFVNKKFDIAKLTYLDSDIFNKLGIKKEEFVDIVGKEIRNTNKKLDLVKKYVKK